MTSLRKSMAFLLVHLALVFNIERLDYNGQNVIDIQSFVYGIILVSILGIVILPVFLNHSVYFSLFVWLSIYVGLKVLIFNQRPLLGDIYTYLTITEMALLTITVFLARDLSRTLDEFETVIEKVTIPKYGQRVLPIKDAGEEIKTEFIRSRRHNRPLSVMVVDMDLSKQHADLQRAVKDVQQVMMQRFMVASMAQIITKEARRTDMIFEQDENGEFVMLCPETTTEGVCVLAERIQTLAKERLGVDVSVGFSSFPEEALSFEDLLQKAEFNVLNPSNLPVYTLPETKNAEK